MNTVPYGHSATDDGYRMHSGMHYGMHGGMSDNGNAQWKCIVQKRYDTILWIMRVIQCIQCIQITGKCIMTRKSILCIQTICA